MSTHLHNTVAVSPALILTSWRYTTFINTGYAGQNAIYSSHKQNIKQ